MALFLVCYPVVESDIVATNQIPCWISNKLNNVIPLWPNVYNERLSPLLSHQHHLHQHQHHLSPFDEGGSSNGATPDLLSALHSPFNITLSSSPSVSVSSTLPSPINNNHNSNAWVSSSVTMVSTPDMHTSPLTSLHHWTREDLIARVYALEQELVQRSLLEPPRLDGWQCRWGTCDVTTSTLEQLTDHLYRIHVGKGKATYYCGWTGCGRHDKPFTKRHKMHNHLRTHTGERPFVCRIPGCHKRFSRPDSLSTHQKTHSNIRPFICMDCGKTYFHARSLRKHLKATQHTSNS
ncbi:hypothetical protein BC941DRAFT_426111 [Chlamydoabsidia padenii]|nr:hypothetical protein BC941DRAFT_426111 [Chlamydoabsidia padenii]